MEALQLELNAPIVVSSMVGLFIPLFIFFVKLIIDFTTIKTKLDALYISNAEIIKNYDEIDELKSDAKVLRMRVDHIEKEIRKTPI